MSQSPITNQFFMSKTGGSTTSLNTDSNVTTPSDLVSNLESIQPHNSIPRAMANQSSVDLTSPTSIHPEHHKLTSKSELDSADPHRPPANRPLFQAGDDLDVSSITDETETDNSTTPLYTPVLSPVNFKCV